jgi:signal transduction histidine kinase
LLHAGAAMAADVTCAVRAEATRAENWAAQTPPLDGWMPVTLPDMWTTRWPEFDGVVWYRLNFDAACAQGQPLAAWMDWLNMAGAIYLNDALLEQDAQLTEPLSRMWNTPRYWLLPAPLLHPGKNHLTVRVSGLAAYAPGLGQVVIGAPADVRPLFDNAWLVRYDLQWFSLATTATLACFFFASWLMRRQERSYGWFSLQSFAWFGVVTNQVATTVWPFSTTDAWEVANTLMFIVYGGSFTMFFISFVGVKPRRTTIALFAFIAFQALAILLAPQARIEEVRAILMTMSATLVICCCLWFSGYALFRRQTPYLVLAACTIIFIAAGVHDLLTFLGVLTNNIYYTALTTQFLMIAMALLLAWRFTQSQNRIEGFNDELTAKVADAQAELGEMLTRQHTLEVTHARVSERLSLANDLHDGLGNTLTNNIITLEHAPRDETSDRFLAVLRELRDDLRNIIDTVATSSHSLAELIAPLRHRIMRSFEVRDVACRWTMPEHDVQLSDTRVAADVMRLLQESLTNALRHSGATAVQVDIGVDGAALLLSIKDNGHGFDPEAVAVTGLGLRSMRMRAGRYGGTFDLRSSEKGTELQIRMEDVVQPLDDAPSSTEKNTSEQSPLPPGEG